MSTKRFLLMMLVMLMGVTGASAQNNVIRYTATEDLGDLLRQLGSVQNREYNPDTREGVITFRSEITNFKRISGLTSLISIDLPTSITSIEKNSFSGCTSLTSINLPASLTSIEGDTFEGCTSLTSISIPAKVTNFGNDAFYGCNSLKTVIINSQQTLDVTGYYMIGDNRYGSGLIRQTFGNQVEEYILRGNITEITPSTKFRNLPITSITLPEKLTSIVLNAFQGCSLQSFTIPESVSNIGRAVLSFCPLQSITVLATTPPTLDPMAFYEVDHSIPVYVPGGTINDYKAANGWKDFQNFVEIVPYRLKLVSSDNSLGKVYGAGIYDTTTEVTIYAVPEAGSKFTGWSDGNTENPRQYVVMSDATLTANFEVVFPEPTGAGVRMKVTKKDNKVYEFKTQDVKNVSFYQADE